MKRMQKIKYILMGVLVAVFFSQLVTPALAALAKKTIDIYTGINIYVDDVKLNPTDVNGNPVQPFVYNGTTYLPVRAVGEAVGKAVQWDGSTSSVYLGKHESVTPAVWLRNMDYFTSAGSFSSTDTLVDNLGNEHTNVIYHVPNSWYIVYDTGSFTRTYKINGQYSRISGTLFQTYQHRSETTTSTNESTAAALKIYGDNQLLYEAEMNGGIEPIKFDVNLQGVLELKVYFFNYYSDESPHAAVGECGLYT